MADPKTIVVADDEPNVRRVLASIIERDGHRALTVADGQQALDALSQHEVHAVITDLRMPKLDGMQLLERTIAEYPEIPIILLTAHGSVDNAVTAVKLGAFDYLEKPFDQQQISEAVHKALRTNDLRRHELRVTGSPPGKGRYGLVGTSTAMQAVYNVIEKVADSPSTVLISGESGTGKELVARAIHEQGLRPEGPLIKVNCAAIPSTLMESELFGYEKGAFTGATSSKPGRFELADHGTLFLDEVGEIPLEMQVKLLRALQENEFERVGGIKTIQVDVRLIAATNADLVGAIEASRFREDLYYRLNVVPIQMPPLRLRLSDLPDLIDHILEKFRSRLGKDVHGVSQDALATLTAYTWPGNIRELENLLERTVLFCEGQTIERSDLPLELTGHADQPDPATANGSTSPLQEGTSLKDIVRAETERLERDLIVAALADTEGNVTHAAKKLQISRKSLQLKMKELGLRETATSGKRVD